VPLGIAAGYFGGIVDNVLMRITDVFLAFPALLLALALASVLSPSVKNATLAIAVTWWPWYARLARGQAASVAGRPYIESCRALAISPWRTLFRHVLPNSVTPVIVQASLDVGGVILTAAALSFLGLGAQDPTPEWGLMVSQGQPYFTTQWWLVTFPGAAILLAALAFNLVGDGLRDRLDPRRVIGR
jgi:peptide/nickel transport system permease protein